MEEKKIFTFSIVNVSYRFVYAVCTFIAFAAVVTSIISNPRPLPWIGILLIVIGICITFYQDIFFVDIEKKVVTKKCGTLGITIKKKYAFSEIADFRLQTYSKGSRRYTRLGIELKSGKQLTVLFNTTEQMADAIANWQIITDAFHEQASETSTDN